VDAKTKRDVLKEMLEHGLTMVHLDARSAGVDVPTNLRDQNHLRLNFSYRFYLDTFDISDEGICASLSFGGTPHLCTIPWTAVFGMMSQVTQQFQIWPEDVPVELLEELQANSNASEESKAEPLEALSSDTAEDTAEDTDEAVLGGAVRRVGHLRVIK
jgi:stringent starvation protein B